MLKLDARTTLSEVNISASLKTWKLLTILYNFKGILSFSFERVSERTQQFYCWNLAKKGKNSPFLLQNRKISRHKCHI